METYDRLPMSLSSLGSEVARTAHTFGHAHSACRVAVLPLELLQTLALIHGQAAHSLRLQQQFCTEIPASSQAESRVVP